MRRRVLLRTLWGDHYLNTKSKKVFSRNINGKMIPMFVQFILNNIWDVYKAALNKYIAFSFLSSLTSADN